MNSKQNEALKDFDESVSRFSQELNSYDVIPFEMVRDANLNALLVIMKSWNKLEPLTKAYLLKDEYAVISELANGSICVSDIITVKSLSDIDKTTNDDNKSLTIQPYYVESIGEVKVWVISHGNSHELTLPLKPKITDEKFAGYFALHTMLWAENGSDWSAADGHVRLGDVLVGAEYLNKLSSDFMTDNQLEHKPLPVFKQGNFGVNSGTPLYVYDAKVSDRLEAMPCDFPNKVFKTKTEFMDYVTEIASQHQLQQFGVLYEDRNYSLASHEEKKPDIYLLTNNGYELQSEEPDTSLGL